jgi:multiple sugar transport system permease protein
MKRRTSSFLYQFTVYLLLAVGALIFILPFLFMLTTSVKPMDQIHAIPYRFIPDPIRLQNYVDAFTVQPLGRQFLNTAFVTVLSVIGTVASCTLAGWGFSRPRFFGRNFLFLLLLSVMMIPGQVTMIPLYLIFSDLGWINSYKPLIVPAFFATPFYVFLVRQFFLTLPYELNEAAVMDGCGEGTIFLRIGLPLVKPAVVTVAVFSFVAVWNDFFTPLLYLNSNEKYTVALGLTAYKAEGFTRWDQLMPASTVAILPVLLVFLFFQRYFVEGMASTGIKE